jgi:hypothetical protein
MLMIRSQGLGELPCPTCTSVFVSPLIEVLPVLLQLGKKLRELIDSSANVLCLPRVLVRDKSRMRTTPLNQSLRDHHVLRACRENDVSEKREIMCEMT